MDTINFTRGVPAPESFPLEEIVQCASAVVREHGPTILQYGPAIGYLPLREWLAKWQGVEVKRVLTGNGSLELVDFLASALLKPGDTVFTETPTYDRIVTTLRKHGANVLGIPLEPDGPNITALEKALQNQVPKFLYLIPDFQNPSGATCSAEKRKKIVELSRKYDFLLIEDSPYRFLRYRGKDEATLLELAAERVVFFSSFTKLLAPGVRLGFMIASEEIVAKVSKIAEDAYITPGYLAHAITFEWCSRGFLPKQIDNLKALYAPRLEACSQALKTYLPDAEATNPDGGFFISVTLPQGVSITAVREEASKLNLNLSDGRGFFPDGQGDRFLRLPFCGISEQQIEEGVKRLAGAVQLATKRS